MDEKKYLDQVKNQVIALSDNVGVVLGLWHPAVAELRRAATNLTAAAAASDRVRASAVAAAENTLAPETFNTDDYDDDGFEDELVQVPENFPGGAEGFQEFMQTQTNVADVNVSSMIGVVSDGNRNIQVGDVQQMAETARELVEQALEVRGLDEDAIVHDRTITITYRRLNGQELTAGQVDQILAHPYSSSLRHLGALQKLDVEATDVPSVKKAVFAVLTDGDMPLNALALGLATYRGTQVFPGIGSVEAVADVTNLVD